MNHLSLFSGGCDGFSVAAEWMGWTNVAHVEIDKWNQKLLRQNFPESEVYGDIREFNRTEAAKYRGCIDIITGGDPCQPHSISGKREGKEDYRYLWPPMFESCKIIGPAIIVNENVEGSISNGVLDTKIDDLESEGYTCESFSISAEAVGCVHERQRIFLVAYSQSHRLERGDGQTKKRQRQTTFRPIETLVENKDGVLCPISELHREYDAIPFGMERIKALGNAVVPQLVYEIFKAIEVLTQSTA